jgi:UDP-3-O-[3-hydroxymyristoyl] glucosamine N-acyltransferase
MRFAIRDVLPLVGPHAFHGDAEHALSEVVPLADVERRPRVDESIVWLRDDFVNRFPERLAGKLGLLILTPAAHEKLKDRPANFLVVEKPRLAFATILAAKFAKTRAPRIEPSAWIDPSAVVGAGCYVGRNVVIEADVRVGAGCTILHNTVIHEGTTIGDRVRVGCNCTIGGDGFGYEKDAAGAWTLIAHVGRVRLEDDVHVHDNTCVDRAVMGETVVGRNAKIDNLVHVAHGVTIGANSLVIANAMLGGGVKIGRDCWIAPSSTIKNKVAVADGTLAGLGCVILKDTGPGSVMIGNPAVTMDEYRRWSKLREQLYLNFDADLR